MKLRRVNGKEIVFFVLMLAATLAPAQTFNTLADFSSTTGAWPSGAMIQGADGNFYGTTLSNTSGGGCFPDNGGCGTVFQLTPAGSLSALYTFCKQTCVDGATPAAKLVQASDGNFYGTTWGGGTSSNPACGTPRSGGCGTVFKLTPAGQLTTLYNFCSKANCTDGWLPDTGLILGSDGNFYGTTSYGGTPGHCPESFGCGTVFKISMTGTLTTLASFCSESNCADGEIPQALVENADGNFYGVTTEGGASSLCTASMGCGTIFKISNSDIVTTLHSFCSEAGCTDGLTPAQLVEGADGNLYGTTNEGGAYSNCGPGIIGCGTIFEITTSGALTTLHSFCSVKNSFGGCSDGAATFFITPPGADGNIYGVAERDGPSRSSVGSVFQLSSDGELLTLYGFCPTTPGQCLDGAQPTGIVRASDGTFYGATSLGGTSENGTAFHLSLAVAVAPTLTPASLSFVNVVVGTTSAPKTVTVKNTNTGYATMDFGRITASSGFAVSSNKCAPTLAAGKQCAIQVTFTPTEVGASSGELTIPNNGPTSPQLATLSGSAIAQAILAPATFTYPTRAVGTTSAAIKFTLENKLATALNDISFATSGDYAVASTTCATTLAAHSNCTVSVTFTPTQKGLRTGQLAASDSANSSPQTSTLSGTGK